jgi:hypothetical protein
VPWSGANALRFRSWVSKQVEAKESRKNPWFALLYLADASTGVGAGQRGLPKNRQIPRESRKSCFAGIVESRGKRGQICKD